MCASECMLDISLEQNSALCCMARASSLRKKKNRQNIGPKMAAEDFLKGFSEDFLQCPICMNRYQTPLMLPCLHSFCSNCLEKWKATAKQQLSCPTCRRQVTLPDTGLKGLPSNFLLTSMIERLDLVGKLTKEKSSNCEFCQNRKSTLFCTDCQLHLCSTCQIGHSRILGTGEHVIIAADKVSDLTYLKEVTSKKPPRCTNHPQEKLRFFCTTCSKLVCRDCTILNHQGHKCCEAEQVFTNAKSSLELHLKQSKSLVQNTLQGCQKLNNLNQLTNTRKAALKGEIDKQYDKYVKLLTTQRDALYDELEKLMEGKNKTIGQILSLSTKWQKSTEETQKIATQILEGNSVWELLGTSTNLIGSFNTLKNEHATFSAQSVQAEAEANSVKNVKFLPTTPMHSNPNFGGNVTFNENLLGSFSEGAPTPQENYQLEHLLYKVISDFYRKRCMET